MKNLHKHLVNIYKNNYIDCLKCVRFDSEENKIYATDKLVALSVQSEIKLAESKNIDLQTLTELNSTYPQIERIFLKKGICVTVNVNEFISKSFKTFLSNSIKQKLNKNATKMVLKNNVILFECGSQTISIDVLSMDDNLIDEEIYLNAKYLKQYVEFLTDYNNKNVDKQVKLTFNDGQPNLCTIMFQNVDDDYYRYLISPIMKEK